MIYKKKLKRWKILKNIKIEKIGWGGVWISTFFNGKKIIINWGVLPDSVVNCRVIKDKKDYIQCQLLEYVELPENLKLDDVCQHNMIFQYFGKMWCNIGCWGCKWQALSYDDQLGLKQKLFEDSFRFMYDLIKDKIRQILPAPVIFGYRNKVEFSFGYCGSSSSWNIESTIWFHKQWRWDEVVDVENCKLISDKANQIYFYIKDKIKKSDIPNYDQKVHQWVFRHLVVRYWFNTSQFLINLVVANQNNVALEYKSKFEEFLNILKNDDFLVTNVKTFILTYNNSLADVVKWEQVQTEVLRWDWYIYEILKLFKKEVKFRISPFSFFQTNTLGAELLFTKAIEYLTQFWKSKYNYILDLYCWTGTIGLSFLKLWLWKRLIGVELLKEAIDDAYINAKINWLDWKVYFNFWKAEKLIWEDQNIKKNLKNIDLVIVDPPRDGLHKNVVKFLIKLKEKINYDLLYISCNPITLARDVKLLLDSRKFDLKILQPVDMFPHTHHIEAISILK